MDNSKDLICENGKNFCPHCGKELIEVKVSVKGWGRMCLKTDSITDVKITQVWECECPFCAGLIDY